MLWSFEFVSYINFQTALIALAVAFFAWHRRTMPGAQPLAGLLVAAALWGVAEAVEGAAPTLTAKIMASKFSHIAIQSLPVFYLLFVVRYAGHSSDMLRRREHWLGVVPMLAVIAVFTNDMHHLFWTSVELVESPFGLESVYGHGPLFWMSTGYLYLLILAATVILLRKILIYQDVYRQQAIILMAATAAPWMANVVYLSGANPIPGFDWTPLAFAVTGILLAWAIFRTGLLDLRPVARTVLFEQMSDVLLVTDGQNRVVDANPAAYDFFSAHSALVGERVEALFAPEVVQTFIESKDDAVVIYKDGVAHQLDVRTTTLTNANGQLNGRLIVLRDTTDRMRLEETLRRSEQRYRTLVDNAPFPSIVSSAVDGVLLYANRRARSLLAIPQTGESSCRLPDLFVSKAESDLLFSKISMENTVPDYEVQLRTFDGRVFWALLSAVPIQYAEEEAILSSINDVTMRREAEQTLVKAKIEAESASRAKSEFLATMSHELRTPLSSVIGLAEALLHEAYGPLNVQQKHSLATISQSGGRLTELVNEVLDLTRLEAGAIKLNYEMALIDEVCQSALHAVKGMLSPGAAPPAYTIQPADLVMKVDPRRLRQVLIHLLSNAIKFTPEPRGVGLEVTALPAQGVVYLVVWDEGIGIDAALQRMLFRPFAQLDSGLTRHYEGTGIGLAIVRHLVELHGGQVTVESEPEKGSRFVVCLPL